MSERRYIEGVTADDGGEQFTVVNVAADGQPPCLAWACTDGGFYPLGTGPELPADERRPYRLSVADLVVPPPLWAR